jgi:hypothetical protein
MMFALFVPGAVLEHFEELDSAVDMFDAHPIA